MPYPVKAVVAFALFFVLLLGDLLSALLHWVDPTALNRWGALDGLLRQCEDTYNGLVESIRPSPSKSAQVVACAPSLDKVEVPTEPISFVEF
ncbi:MAG TPA: hypothetical protein VGE59_00395 [Patescibacteria group bacterium]